MPDAVHTADVAIIGGGLAGIATALELLDRGLHVVVLDRDTPDRFGGLAKWSFGGIFLVDTPEQRRLGIRDTPELALSDWLTTGEIHDVESAGARWARAYVESCGEFVDAWLRKRGVRFFPVVHWVERGQYRPGNSVPRFHMVWGTGHRLVEVLTEALKQHAGSGSLKLLFRHRATGLEVTGGRVTGLRGAVEPQNAAFRVKAHHVVIAAGGYCGNMDWLREHWDPELGTTPVKMLNGSHRFATGEMHRAVEASGGALTSIDRVWYYAAGVHHPKPHHPEHGLSVIPPKSALWLNYRGERIGPEPLVAGFDTRFLVQQICHQEKQYSWQVMNWKIACKELAVSGSEFNEAMRDRKPLAFLRTVLRGNEPLVDRLTKECIDFVVADTIEELAERMNETAGTDDVDVQSLSASIRVYDERIRRGGTLWNDEQLRRIAQLRRYRGDRVRTCKFQPILDNRAGPLVAIREFVLSRKSMGGILTDLSSRVLRGDGDETPIPGLYAAGEAAGFGGGGIHGKRSLEGTFLATCVFTGRVAAQSIARG